MVDTGHHKCVHTHRMDRTIVNPNVTYELWVTITCQCSFIYVTNVPLESDDMDKGRLYMWDGHVGILCNFYSILLWPVSALNIKVTLRLLLLLNIWSQVRMSFQRFDMLIQEYKCLHLLLNKKHNITAQQLPRPLSKKHKISSVGKNVEKLDPYALLDEISIAANNMKNNMKVSQKIKNRIVLWCSLPTFGHILKKLQRKLYKSRVNTHAHCSIIHKTCNRWKQPKWPSTDEQVKKM